MRSVLPGRLAPVDQGVLRARRPRVRIAAHANGPAPGLERDTFLALPRAALRLIRTADATGSVRAGLRNTAAGWCPAGRHRKGAINQFATLGEDRFTRHRA